jgi:hypothetical protein
VLLIFYGLSLKIMDFLNLIKKKAKGLFDDENHEEED